jgi:protein-S-isoprenylcysteine O-methyltransferase Ste14
MPTGASRARKWRNSPSPTPAVQEKLAGFTLLKADVTANNADDKALLARFQLFGPPGIIFFAADGRQIVRTLRQAKTQKQQRMDNALYEFEKTDRLISHGVFRYIRHPMYTSLLALAWGAYFQAPSWPGAALAAFSSLFLVLTARADEQECLAFFGQPYADYMQGTKRFIPFVL